MNLYEFSAQQLNAPSDMAKTVILFPMVNITIKWIVKDFNYSKNEVYGSPIITREIQNSKFSFSMQLVRDPEYTPTATYTGVHNMLSIKRTLLLKFSNENEYSVASYSLKGYVVQRTLKFDLFYEANSSNHGMSDKTYEFLVPNDHDRLMIVCHLVLCLREESLKSPLHQKQDNRDFEKLMHDASFSDITLKIGEHEIKAHKAILAARSPTFKSIFDSSKNLQELNIDDVDHEVMKVVLRYIYTGKIDQPNYHAAVVLLPVAEKYGLRDLIAKFEDELCKTKLNKALAISFLLLADEFVLDNLKAYAMDGVLKYLLLMDRSDFLKIHDANTMLLVEILTQSSAKNAAS